MFEKLYSFLENLFLNYLVVFVGVYCVILPFALHWYYSGKPSEVDALGTVAWMFIGSFMITNIFIPTFYFFTLLFRRIPLIWNNKILIILAAIPDFFVEEIRNFIRSFVDLCNYNSSCFFVDEELLIVYIPCLFLYFLFQKQIQAQTKRFSSFWGRVFFGE